jgi:hypothetical protein
MAEKQPLSFTMRIIHRYLGFFLAGVMAMYAISGITLVFRNTDTFKQEVSIEKTIAAKLNGPALGQVIKIKNLGFIRTVGEIDYFNEGSYNHATGEVIYVKKELPFVLDKITHLHKATTNDPLYFLNIFFGLSLLFFVVSAFWMYMPGGKILRKGLLFTAGGIILTLIMLFV